MTFFFHQTNYDYRKKIMLLKKDKNGRRKKYGN